MTAIPEGTWDFDDLEESERRFRALLEEHPDGPGRAEVLSQLARVEGMRGDFEAADRLLREADPLAGRDVTARVRVLLERGRMLRSGGKPRDALPFFEAAFDEAREGGEAFLAGDAAHMAALAADEEGFVTWTERGIAHADEEPAAAYWLGPLLNNIGWHHYDSERYDEALDAFQRALDARERQPEKPEEIEIARYCVGKTLRALDRAEEAAPLLERCVAWTEEIGKPDGFFHEELAEIYWTLERDADAAEQAAIAFPLLDEQDPGFDDERRARLEELAGS